MCPRPHPTDKKYSFAKFQRICWRYVVTITCLTYLSLAFWKVTSAFSASVLRLASCDSYSCLHKTSSWHTSCKNTHTKLSILILSSIKSNFSQEQEEICSHIYSAKKHWLNLTVVTASSSAISIYLLSPNSILYLSVFWYSSLIIFIFTTLMTHKQQNSKREGQ